MFRYLFTAIEFAPGGSSWQTCTKIGKRQHTRGNNKQNNTKTQNTKNRKKYKTRKQTQKEH
jgi:ABC-type microcin C transport system permease subunit YejB